MPAWSFRRMEYAAAGPEDRAGRAPDRKHPSACQTLPRDAGQRQRHRSGGRRSRSMRSRAKTLPGRYADGRGFLPPPPRPRACPPPRSKLGSKQNCRRPQPRSPLRGFRRNRARRTGCKQSAKSRTRRGDHSEISVPSAFTTACEKLQYAASAHPHHSACDNQRFDDEPVRVAPQRAFVLADWAAATWSQPPNGARVDVASSGWRTSVKLSTAFLAASSCAASRRAAISSRFLPASLSPPLAASANHL